MKRCINSKVVVFFSLKPIHISQIEWKTGLKLVYLLLNAINNGVCTRHNLPRLILLKRGLFSWSPRGPSFPVSKEEIQSSEGVAFEFARVYYICRAQFHAGITNTIRNYKRTFTLAGRKEIALKAIHSRFSVLAYILPSLRCVIAENASC